MIAISSTAARRLAPLALSLLAALPCHAEEPTNKNCPIMTDDEADVEEKVTYQGKDIYFCCGPCVKQFNQDPDYFVALFQDMKSVPAVQDLKVPEGVTLLEQRYCPFSPDRLIGPSSPSVEYKGVTVYLSTKKHLKSWEADPDGSAKKAVAEGLLPQLKDKA